MSYKFTKTHEIDKEKFAELLKAAKGARTMKDFSEKCGVNPSTFTRIIHKLNKGSSSTQLLEAIADNAEPNSGVTIQELADSNGYTVEIDLESKETKVATRGSNLQIFVRNVVVQELLDRKAQVRMGNIRYEIGKTLSLSPDALIMTNAFGKEGEIWFVDSILMSTDISSNPRIKTNAKRMAFDKISRFVFISMHKEELLKPSRFSLAFFDKEIFDLIIDEFSETNVSTYISLILIDTLNSKIIDEFVLPEIGKENKESYFMTHPVPEDQDIECLISDEK